MGRAIDIVKVKAEIAAGKLAAIAENGNVLLKDMQSGEAVKIATLPQLSNEALTLEELRGMGGQPYWHVGRQDDSKPPHWAILDPFYAKHIEDYKYGENWIAYRRPPEGESNA